MPGIFPPRLRTQTETPSDSTGPASASASASARGPRSEPLRGSKGVCPPPIEYYVSCMFSPPETAGRSAPRCSESDQVKAEALRFQTPQLMD